MGYRITKGSRNIKTIWS